LSIRLDESFIDIAPPPIFSWLKGFDNWMIRGVEVLGSVFVFGGVATADMTADQTFTQMYPAIAHF
jgi:hypothetical protein